MADISISTGGLCHTGVLCPPHGRGRGRGGSQGPVVGEGVERGLGRKGRDLDFGSWGFEVWNGVQVERIEVQDFKCVFFFFKV